jgi:ADP-heptose:LPS heptosyltransferase
LDRLAGGLACAAISPLAALMRALSRKGVPEPRRILIVKFFGLGSLLRGWPLLAGLRSRHPKAELHLLTFASNREIARRLDVFSRIRSVDSATPLRLARDLLAHMGGISAARYDVVIDMEFFSNFASLLTALTRAPVRLGYYLREGFRESLLTRIVAYNPARHITEVYAALGRALGVEAAAAEPPPIRSTPEERRRLDALLARRGAGASERLVVLNAASSGLCDERRWPPDRFAWLHDRLLDRGAGRLVYVGAGAERPLVDDVLRRCRPGTALNLAGETDLGALIALLERAALVVTNDGGPAHLADAVGAPLIVLFGPESPAHYGPLGPRAVAFHAGLYCSPCLNAVNTKVAPCGGRNACMQAIPPEDVLEAAELLLRGETLPEARRAFWRGYGGRHAREDWKSWPAPGA